MKFSRKFFFSFLIFWSFAVSADSLGKLRKEAENGDPQSMLLLGNKYFYGSKDARQNLTLAAYWYQRSSSAGNVDGMFSYAV